MRPSVVAAAVVLLATSACASYESTSPPAPVVSQMQISQVAEDIRVEADPYSDPVEQETYFDANFNAAGIVAIQVRVSNNSTKSYLVRSHDMALEVTEDVVFINAPDYLENVDVDFVELYTAVLDKQKHPVEGLERADFTVLEDGVFATNTSSLSVDELATAARRDMGPDVSPATP